MAKMKCNLSRSASLIRYNFDHETYCEFNHFYQPRKREETHCSVIFSNKCTKKKYKTRGDEWCRYLSLSVQPYVCVSSVPVTQVRGLAEFEGVQDAVLVCHVACHAQVVLQATDTLPYGAHHRRLVAPAALEALVNFTWQETTRGREGGRGRKGRRVDGGVVG